jgi:hypothetical protein
MRGGQRSDFMMRIIAIGIISLAVPIFNASPLFSGNTFTQDEIISAAKKLGGKIEMPEEKIGDLIQNFKRACEDNDFKQTLKDGSISAVFVYRATEAGLLYKRMRGHGLIMFKETGETKTVNLSGASLGAQVGGSAEWGLGIAIGLKHPSHFGGSYSGRKKSATAADSTATWGEFFSNTDHAESNKVHDICFIVTGRGLSAGVGKGKITISLED